MTEPELAGHVVAWLCGDGWDVYQEVVLGVSGRRVDIVAVRGRLIWAIECKTAMTFGVIDQAMRHPVHLRSVAVPGVRGGDRGRKFAEQVCRDRGVGVLILEPYSAGSVRVVVPAQLLRHNDYRAKEIRDGLVPEQKVMAPAGSQGGHWTPFAGTMLEVRRFITEHPGCTLREIVAALRNGSGHYSDGASCRSHLPRALELLAPWCRVEKGRPRRYFVVEPIRGHLTSATDER